jgi:transcription elongation factor Elf1
MLTCPSCGTADLKGSTISEVGFNTNYKLTKNPKRGNPTMVASTFDNSEVQYTLICVVCGAESEVEDASFTIAKK